MYKLEVWKSDLDRNNDVLYLYETYDTSKGLTKQDCKDNVKQTVDRLKELGNCNIGIVETTENNIYRYDYKTKKEWE